MPTAQSETLNTNLPCCHGPAGGRHRGGGGGGDGRLLLLLLLLLQLELLLKVLPLLQQRGVVRGRGSHAERVAGCRQAQLRMPRRACQLRGRCLRVHLHQQVRLRAKTGFIVKLTFSQRTKLIVTKTTLMLDFHVAGYTPLRSSACVAEDAPRLQT